MLKWIINGLLLYGAYKLFTSIKGDSSSKVEKKKASSRDKTREGDLVEDPQCGVYIPVEHAVKGPGGKRFCSEECAEAFKNRKEG
jgi:hypothetical protein